LSEKFLETIGDPNSVITPIDTAIRFPEILEILLAKYKEDIESFIAMVMKAKSSAELLDHIRQKSIPAERRMSLLKMFRRCVAPVLDTETTKKLKIPTMSLVENYGTTFKPIDVLKQQFGEMEQDAKGALAALIGEYDTRGQLGYILTENFFTWFEQTFEGVMTIRGPRGAGRDVELNTIFPDFDGQYPCDFVITDVKTDNVLAVGFARYDSTRGGAQSDDRTGGNSYKVTKAKEYCEKTGKKIRLLFLSDGPGLGHVDTWKEACNLDGQWDGNVRVATMKLAEARITRDWLNPAALK
jgi:hypothetical protein